MSKNKFPIKKYRSILDFSLDYSKLISPALKKNFNQISSAALEIEKKIKKKNTIFVCGNGGSSALANHFVCDYLKGLSIDTNNSGSLLRGNSDNNDNRNCDSNCNSDSNNKGNCNRKISRWISIKLTYYHVTEI